jgi:hypothetical protein
MSGQTVLQRGWTFVRDAGLKTQTLISHSATPFLRRRLDGAAQMKDVIQWANLVDRDIEEATVGSRSLPFGAGGTVIESYAFTSGAKVQIPHLLKTSSAFAIWLVPSAGTPTATISFDDTYATIIPAATFTAGLLLLVRP